MSWRARHRRGFTLLEMLIAIGLLLVLVGSMFAFLFDMLSARARALETAGRQLAATTLIDALEADLLTCLVGDAEVGSGIEGDNQRLRVLTRGVAGTLAERGAADPAVLGDLQVTEYRHDARTGRIEAKTSPGTFEPLGGSVHRVRFRYHDGQGWQDTFDSLDADRLPVAVEILVWFLPWPGEEAALATAAPPPGAVAERRTFDASGGFDELAFARASDLERFDEPAPDRFRVIAIPDARPGDESPEPGSLARLP